MVNTKLFILLAVSVFGFFLPESAFAVRPKVVKAVQGLQFSPLRFQVKPGAKVVLRVENKDPNDQPHNLVIIKPNSLAEIQAAANALIAGGEATDYVPKHPAVIASTKLLKPDKKETIEFTAPKEPGVYNYVCTYPGHAYLMYGALYVGENIKHKLQDDPNIPEVARNQVKMDEEAKIIKTRPATLRLFMPNSGPASIAVAIPNNYNFCWDAGNCRLRYAWKGKFLNPFNMYNSNGNHLADISGDIFWKSSGNELNYGIQTENNNAKPSFKGYRMINDIPEFHYDFDGMSIREHITSTDGKLFWNFKIADAPSEVKILAPGKVTSSQGKRDGDYWKIDAETAKNFTLIIEN